MNLSFYLLLNPCTCGMHCLTVVIPSHFGEFMTDNLLRYVASCEIKSPRDFPQTEKCFVVAGDVESSGACSWPWI